MNVRTPVTLSPETIEALDEIAGALSSRARLIDSRFSSAVCAPVYPHREGLATEVRVGTPDGLKHDSSILCDALVSLAKSVLTDFVSALSPGRMVAVDDALRAVPGAPA